MLNFLKRYARFKAMEQTKNIAKKGVFICKKCFAEIGEKKYNQAILDHFIPLCDSCEPLIREKMKKWYPLFQNMKF